MLWTSKLHEALSDCCVGIQAISVKARTGCADYSDANALQFVQSEIMKAIGHLEESIINDCRERDSHIHQEAANDPADCNR